jgi:L-alanine-DL-glutamate epimerase-like enolase superfamily enzyme
VANLARAYGLPVSMTNCQADFMGQVAAAMPHHTMLEVLDCGRDQCLNCTHRLEDGYIVYSDEPGFGVSVNETKLAALKANPPTGTGKFPFPRREGAGRYLVPPE